MDSQRLHTLEREYTCSQISFQWIENSLCYPYRIIPSSTSDYSKDEYNVVYKTGDRIKQEWKRTLTDVDMKRRKAAERERSRLHIDIVEKISNPTLDFEVKNFKLFGGLRGVATEVHNTVPTSDTVNAEKDYIEFEQLRKHNPDAVQYNNIYASIHREASKPRTPLSVTSSMTSLRRSTTTPRRPLTQPSPLSESSLFPRSSITPSTPKSHTMTS